MLCLAWLARLDACAREGTSLNALELAPIALQYYAQCSAVLPMQAPDGICAYRHRRRRRFVDVVMHSPLMRVDFAMQPALLASLHLEFNLYTHTDCTHMMMLLIYTTHMILEYTIPSDL